MEQLILSRLHAERIECQLRHASTWNVYLQELKRLLRTKKRGLGKHPERHIGKDIDTDEEQIGVEQDLPGEKMAKYLLDNVSELVSSVIAPPSGAPETIYFLLDLLHCCDKQQQQQQQQEKKGSGTTTQSSSKKRKAQSSSATATATSTSTSTVESPLLSAIKQLLQKGGCTALHTAVDFQLYFKLCDILTHISSIKEEEEEEDEEEGGREEGNGSALLEECTIVTERYVAALFQQQQQQHDGDDGKKNIFHVPSLAAPGCLLFEGREMAKVVPARLFALLVHQANRTTGMGLRRHYYVSAAASLLRPLRCMASVLFPSSSAATGTTNGAGQQQQTMLGLLQVLSASDDDLVDTLLDLTELWQRCCALPSSSASSAPVFVEEVQTLFVTCFGVGVSPLSNDGDYNDGNNNHSDKDAVSLPIVLFLWFTQYALCCDEGVALDLLLSPETRALEYFLRCTKLMATSSSTQIAASRQAMVAMVSAMAVVVSESSEPSSSSSSQSADAGGTVVVWEHQQQWSRVSPAVWTAGPSKPVLAGYTLAAPLPLSEIRAFLERFLGYITGSRSTSGLRASKLLSKRLETVVKLIRDL
jgi:hypothetical protein